YLVNDMRYLMAMADHLGRVDEAEQWARRAQALADPVNEHLWDETDGFYYDRTERGEPVRIMTAAGFLPLFAGIPDERRAERLLEHLLDPGKFWTPFPVPSVAVDEPCFEPDMWRGPTWVNVDLLIVLGLRRYAFADVARELTGKVLAGIEHWYCMEGAIYEFYDTFSRTAPALLDRKQRLCTDQGLAPIADYNGSAACYLALATGSV
ncbi:MAG TPA: trehalase family glycosidase, partial [Planctomycetota bacterium]|nr:trehalase family glycosidase [Planctomycetota bacterium]